MKYITKHEAKWGLIFFAAALLWMVFEKLMGWHGERINLHPIMTNIFFIPAVAIFVFALLEKRQKHYNGSMTWLQGFMCGLVISCVVMILSPLSQYITNEFISPEYFSNVINYAVEHEGKNRQEMEAYFNVNNYMVQSAVGAIVMGAVTSAIVAIFVKKK